MPDAPLDVPLGLGGPPLSDLLRAVEAVPGLAFRSSEAPERHVRTAPRPRLVDFRETASPFVDGTFDSLYERYRHKLSMAVCETNRGCPFACTFCDWGQAVASRVYELPLERVPRLQKEITRRARKARTTARLGAHLDGCLRRRGDCSRSILPRQWPVRNPDFVPDRISELIVRSPP